MALICENGFGPCTGCAECSQSFDICSGCGRILSEGDKYYKLYGKIVCDRCTTKTDKESEGVCILCRKPLNDGFRYKDIALCRSCSKVATGYSGYI